MVAEDSEHLRIVAIIQARMGSTRLPGKVLKPIAGQPLLWHVVTRLKRSRLIEEVAVATSTNPRDDAIVEYCEGLGVAVVRGPEDNVLARFARAAEVLDADIIVRVSSDAPFVDADFIDHLVASMIEQSADYVLMEEGAVTAHEGVDPLTRRALDKLMMDAPDDPVAREHVTGYFKLHPGFVKIARAAPYPALARSDARFTIDTPDDLTFVEALHARLNARAGEASLSDLLLLLEREPQLTTPNAPPQQAAIVSRGGLALIFCNGGGAFGYGHVKRMVALARAMRDGQGIGVMFAVVGEENALEPIRRVGFEAVHFAQYDAGGFSQLVESRTPNLLVLDCREGPSRAELDALRRSVGCIAVIDDGSERRLVADRAYYPPMPKAAVLDWTGSRSEPRIGWQWVLLGATQAPQVPRKAAARQTLLVSFGGSDPMHLTERCALALARLDPVFRARFVIGPGFDDPSLAARIARLAPNFETIENANSLATEFASADLALCAFGVTAYELAACGVPALYLALSDDHATSASAFEKAGIGEYLGLADAISDQAISTAVKRLLADVSRRREMRAAGLMTLDSEGAGRIAADLAQLLSASAEEKRRKSSQG